MVNMIRKSFRFYGEVQGVGFRYKATQVARELKLTGFVRNESDGTVYMEAQGLEEKIDMLLMQLNNDRYIDIDDMDMKSMNVVTSERNFGIVSGW